MPGAYPSSAPPDTPWAWLSSDLIEIWITVLMANVANTITLVRGDDYRAADGRSLDFTSASWPESGSGPRSPCWVKSSDVDTITGSVVDASTIRIEVTAVDGGNRHGAVGLWTFWQCCPIPHVVTLVSGILVVTPDAVGLNA